MLKRIDWNRFYENAIPSLFHGDLQPENILYDVHNMIYDIIYNIIYVIVYLILYIFDMLYHI